MELTFCGSKVSYTCLWNRYRNRYWHKCRNSVATQFLGTFSAQPWWPLYSSFPMHLFQTFASSSLHLFWIFISCSWSMSCVRSVLIPRTWDYYKVYGLRDRKILFFTGDIYRWVLWRGSEQEHREEQASIFSFVRIKPLVNIWYSSQNNINSAASYICILRLLLQWQTLPAVSGNPVTPNLLLIRPEVFGSNTAPTHCQKYVYTRSLLI